MTNLQELKFSLKCSLDIMKSGEAEGDSDNSYHIIYKDGSGVIFIEGEVDLKDIKKIKTTNIIYMDFQGSDCHLNSITGNFEEGEENDNNINNFLSKYNLEYSKIQYIEM